MKGQHTMRLSGRQLTVFFAALQLCGGCASLRIITKPYESGRILLLPPRDVVQNGVAHLVGVGSGRILQEDLRSAFADTAFELVTTDSGAFRSTQVAPIAQGLEEAKRLNADYCLQIILGEFLNAAPMSWRADYVYVERAAMYDVRTGEAVWELYAPVYREKANIGNHYPLLGRHARAITRSIIKNME